MPMYRTAYVLPNGETAHTQCYAENPKHLDEVMALRGMGEVRSDPKFLDLAVPNMASALILQGKIAHANHALTWTAMIAVRAGVVDAWSLLNDRGVLHEMAHEVEMTERDRNPETVDDFYGSSAAVRRDILARRIEAFERLVPGVHPCWAGEDTRSIYQVIREQQRAEIAARFPTSDLYDYQRDTVAALITAFSGRWSTPPRQGREVAVEARQAVRELTDVLQERLEIKSPTAKPNSRKFAEHQRNQGRAVRDGKKADLVAKLKKNLAGEDIGGTMLKSVQSNMSALFGRSVLKVNGEEVAAIKDVSVSIDREVAAIKDVSVSIDREVVDKLVMGIDLGVSNASYAATVPFCPRGITGRMISDEPVTYHMTREGPPIRMVGGKGTDEEDRARIDSAILQTLARKKQDAITRIMMGALANG